MPSIACIVVEQATVSGKQLQNQFCGMNQVKRIV